MFLHTWRLYKAEAVNIRPFIGSQVNIDKFNNVRQRWAVGRQDAKISTRLKLSWSRQIYTYHRHGSTGLYRNYCNEQNSAASIAITRRYSIHPIAYQLKLVWSLRIRTEQKLGFRAINSNLRTVVLGGKWSFHKLTAPYIEVLSKIRGV